MMAGLLSLLRLDPMFCIYQKIASGTPKTAPAPSPEDPKLPATPGHSGTGPGTKKVKENQRKSKKIKRKSKENQRKSKKIKENRRKSKKIKENLTISHPEVPPENHLSGPRKFNERLRDLSCRTGDIHWGCARPPWRLLSSLGRLQHS